MSRAAQLTLIGQSELKTTAQGQRVQEQREPDLALQHITAQEWDEIVATFDGVSHEQLHAFASSRWPTANCETVLIRKDGAAVAGALMMIQALPLKLGKVAISKWGPVLKDRASEEAGDTYMAAVKALTAEYADRRGMMISLLERAPRPPFENACEKLTALGFRQGPQLFAEPDRYLVNLQLSDEEMRNSLHQKWRYQLKKSQKEELEFIRAAPDEFGEFEKLYRAMIGRKSFDDHSAYDDTIGALMKVATPSLKPEVFFVRHQDQIIAGALVFKTGDTAEYLYGATADEALPLRAGYFLQWHIIRWLRDNTKARWYDLGGNGGESGLHQFKKGLVGKVGLITPIPPLANYASGLWPSMIGTAAFAIKDSLNWLKRALSKKLRRDEK